MSRGGAGPGHGRRGRRADPSLPDAPLRRPRRLGLLRRGRGRGPAVDAGWRDAERATSPILRFLPIRRRVKRGEPLPRTVMRLKPFLGRLDRDRIVRAIQAAESHSRGEIRVHASNRAMVDVQKAAAEQFEKLGMAGTAEGTGVLIFVAPLSRNFAILGDYGIHARCGDELWRAVAAAMNRTSAPAGSATAS